MEELNSVAARKLDPISRMQKLQRAILVADAQSRVRASRVSKAHTMLAGIVLLPYMAYMGYHFFHYKG